MASNPNPFATQLNQLNGVTFGANQIGIAPGGAYGGSRDPTYFEVGTPTTLEVNTVQYNSAGIGGLQGPGTLTVVNTTYKPRYMNSSYPEYYYLATFGTVSFSNVKYPDSVFGDPGSPKSFVVIGFSEDGLVLVPQNRSDQLRTYFYSNGVAGGVATQGVYILSPSGFGTADGVNFPVTFGNNSSVYAEPPPCFAEGTRIETSAGPVLVENLAEGDMVLTASRTERAIKWIGQSLVRPSFRAMPHEANPVRVKAHAFGPDMPARDVRLSPGHAVLVDGVLVPVGLLINGATIVQESVESVRYFHVELETHDVLLAEGLPCESYFDDGNRASFANAGPFAELRGRLDPKSWDNACAPMVAAGPQLAQLQQRLQARAGSLGWTKTEEAALTVEVDGATIAPVHMAGNRHWFAVPACTALTLRSNAGVLAHVLPGLDDRRTLGVAVSELRVDGVAIDLASDAFGMGFHAVERGEDHAWRWTDGAAALTLATAAPAMIEVTLAMVAPSWRRRVPELRVVA